MHSFSFICGYGTKSTFGKDRKIFMKIHNVTLYVCYITSLWVHVFLVGVARFWMSLAWL